MTGYKCCLISCKCNTSIDEDIQKGSSPLTKVDTNNSSNHLGNLYSDF